MLAMASASGITLLLVKLAGSFLPLECTYHFNLVHRVCYHPAHKKQWDEATGPIGAVSRTRAISPMLGKPQI